MTRELATHPIHGCQPSVTSSALVSLRPSVYSAPTAYTGWSRRLSHEVSANDLRENGLPPISPIEAGWSNKSRDKGSAQGTGLISREVGGSSPPPAMGRNAPPTWRRSHAQARWIQGPSEGGPISIPPSQSRGVAANHDWFWASRRRFKSCRDYSRANLATRPSSPLRFWSQTKSKNWDKSEPVSERIGVRSSLGSWTHSGVCDCGIRGLTSPSRARSSAVEHRLCKAEAEGSSPSESMA